MALTLFGKVSIITGASAGIGRSTAILFSNLGSKLALVGRNEKNLDETIELCNKDRRNDILKLIGDINDPVFCQNIVDSAINKFQKIDILVNNAGIYKGASLETLDLSDFDSIMSTNVRSIIVLTKLCLPYLIAQKGSIVNNSSINGTCSMAGVLAYSMSKAALDQFTKCLALELADKQVRVNSVNPGTVQTNIVKTSGATDDEFNKFIKQANKIHPLGRIATPEEVAESIAFLASDKSSFITGSLLHVDGGIHIVTPR